MRFNRFTTETKRTRLVTSSGKPNISHINIPHWRQKYIKDYFTTLVDLKWRWNFIIFIATFSLTWVIFGAYYQAVEVVYTAINNGTSMNCVENVHNFVSAFLFSIETQTTIGFGSSYVHVTCPPAYIGVIIQSIFGAALEFALAGLVFAKIGRGKKRVHTLLFSHVACVYERDGTLQLVIRIANIRRSEIMKSTARGVLVKKELSADKRMLPSRQYPFDFCGESGHLILFLAWPTYIFHIIDKNSPFWHMSRDDIMQASYEIVINFEGTVGTTGKPIQISASYLPWDVIWGHRFMPLEIPETEESQTRRAVFDLTNFHRTYPVPTPWSSAYHRSLSDRELREVSKHTSYRLRLPSIHCMARGMVDTFLTSPNDYQRAGRLIKLQHAVSLQIPQPNVAIQGRQHTEPGLANFHQPAMNKSNFLQVPNHVPEHSESDNYTITIHVPEPLISSTPIPDHSDTRM